MSDETKYVIMHESVKASIIKDFAAVGWLGFAVAANHLLGGGSDWVDLYVVFLAALYLFSRIGSEKVTHMTFSELAERVDRQRGKPAAANGNERGNVEVEGVEVVGFRHRDGEFGVGIRMMAGNDRLMAPYTLDEARDLADGILVAVADMERRRDAA